MNDDDLDRRLAERGARWRADQPQPPEVDPAAFSGRSLPRWVVPAAAAAAVVTVVAGSFLLVDRDGRSDGPVNTPSPSVSEDPLADVVPWKLVGPRHPKFPKPVQTYVPDPSYADGVPTCTPGQLIATTRLGAAAGTMSLEITFAVLDSVKCALRELPTVTLYDGERPLDLSAEPRPPDDATWPYDVLLDAVHRGKLVLTWTSLWCVAPVHNDSVHLDWPQGGVLVDGFGPSPGCNNPGSGERRGVKVLPFEPEHWEVQDGPPVLAPIEARQVDFVAGPAREPSTLPSWIRTPRRTSALPASTPILPVWAAGKASTWRR